MHRSINNLGGTLYTDSMRRRRPNYSIAWLLICTTIIAACLGVIVSPNMWTTSAVAAVRLFLVSAACIVVLNRRARCPRAPVAFLAASIVFAIADPWHADSDMVTWMGRMLQLDLGPDDEAWVGLWHIWSLMWTVICTLFIMAFLKPRPLHWR